jgi:hypothetical protein
MDDGSHFILSWDYEDSVIIHSGPDGFKIEKANATDRPGVGTDLTLNNIFVSGDIFGRWGPDDSVEKFNFTNYHPTFYMFLDDNYTKAAFINDDGKVYEISANETIESLIELDSKKAFKEISNDIRSKLESMSDAKTDISYRGSDFKLDESGGLEARKSKATKETPFTLDPRTRNYQFKTIQGPFIYAPELFGK